jgi:hypothetical protein
MTTKLAYIGGYGHSGSTLLEYLLAFNAAVVACGEVVSAIRKGKKEKCTCGNTAKACPVWRVRFKDRGIAERGWSHQDLLLALIANLPAGSTVLVDSSKTARGAATTPFRMKRKLGPDFLLIHNVRDPRGVCWSVLKQATRKAKRERRPLPNSTRLYAASAAGWWVANLSCELFGWLYPNQYVRIRYEDLAGRPEGVVGDLHAALRLEGKPVTTGTTNANRHQLHGNRMRHKELLLKDIKEDGAWKSDMPLNARRLVSCLTFPLRRRYAYG